MRYGQQTINVKLTTFKFQFPMIKDAQFCNFVQKICPQFESISESFISSKDKSSSDSSISFVNILFDFIQFASCSSGEHEDDDDDDDDDDEEDDDDDDEDVE